MKWILILFFLAGCASKPSVFSGSGGTFNFQVTSKILDAALKQVNLDEYDLKTMTVGDTSFHILGRKKDGIGLDRLEKALLKMWPVLSEQFADHPDEAAIIDLDEPLGGGPLDKYIVGIYYSQKVSVEHQTMIQEALGWAPRSSTEGYIKKYYSEFKNPFQAYTDDMMVHELGHLFFGWGLTQIEDDETGEHWFSYGMGLLYDRIAWGQMHRRPSPLFQNVIDTYQNQFAKNTQIDQRLISPDESKDQANKLQRLQVYGHGKSFLFLSALKEKIGSEQFDQLTNSLIHKGKRSDYNSFLGLMSSKQEEKTEEVEKLFSIR